MISLYNLSLHTISLVTISRDYWFYTSPRVWSTCLVVITESLRCAYFKLWKRWVIFMILIAKDGEESHRCGLSLFLQLSFQFQTSELVINAPTKSINSLTWPDQFIRQPLIHVWNIDKLLACKLVWPHKTRAHQTEALNSVVCLYVDVGRGNSWRWTQFSNRIG